MRNHTLLAGMFLLATSVSGQVFVVDAYNGPGTHFTDLPTAASAVPDGATLLVRPGLYHPFAVMGKGLKVVGDPSFVVYSPTNASLIVTGTRPTQPTLLRNLELGTPVVLSNCAGAVVLEGCREGTIFFSLTRGISITACRNVWLHGCTLDGPQRLAGLNALVHATDSQVTVSRSTVKGDDGWRGYYGPSPSGNPAITLVRSRCFVVASTLRGGDGGPGCSGGLGGCYADGGAGGPACSVDFGAILLSLGSDLSGGNGGAGASFYICCACTVGGPGGAGIAVSGRAHVLGGTLRGGLGGRSAGCGGGVAGAPFTGTGSITIDGTAQTNSGWINGVQQRGQTIQFSLQAPANSPAVLLLSYSLDLVPLEPLAYGSLLAAPAVVLGPYIVGGSGVLQVPWTLPNTLHLGELYGGQFLSLDPVSAQLRVTNPLPLLVHR